MAVDITIKAGTEIEAISLDEEAAQALLGTGSTNRAEKIKQWLYAQARREIAVHVAQSLIDQYVTDHFSEAS